MTEKIIGAAVDLAAEAVKNPEPYKDALQPAAKGLGPALAPAGRHVGEGLTRLARGFNAIMSCLKPFIWGLERVKEIIEQKVEEEFKDKPERLIPPDPVVAVPAIQALQYSAQSPTLREMYLNLLAASMDKETAAKAHPAFVETIKQLTPDEAKIVNVLFRSRRLPCVTLTLILRDFGRGQKNIIENFSHIPDLAECEHPELIRSNLDNICRLRLAAFAPLGMHMVGEGIYERLVDDDRFRKPKEALEKTGQGTEVRRGFIELTAFGTLFCSSCLPKEVQQKAAPTHQTQGTATNTDGMPRLE